MIESRRFRAVFAAFALFSLFAGDFWRYSVGWWVFGAIVLTMLGVSIALLVHHRERWHIERLPYPLTVFLALATLSILWSFYPGGTALGLIATWITVVIGVALAVSYSWTELLRALGHAMRLLLGLSFLFEFIVSAFIRHPILPLVPSYGVDYDSLETVPKLLYWSRDLFFEGGKIQGIVGNSSLLGFIALISLIVFGLQFAAGTVHRVWGGFWILVAIAAVACTRSATIIVAIAVILAVLVVVLLLRRFTGRAHAAVYAVTAALVAGALILVSTMGTQLLALLGKSSDLTGRLDIWATVISLAQERPVAGWGWISFWIPWIEPFDNLVFASGVRQLHAHNAWVDIFLQLGVLGLVVFGALVLSTLVRSWQFAVERPIIAPLSSARHTIVSLLPLLLLVALLVQSVAESRLIIEYGMALLTVIAVKSKVSQS